MGEAILLSNKEVPLNKLRALMKEVAEEAFQKSEKADKLFRDKIKNEINQLSNQSNG
jgi:hypothetical protein